MRSIFIASLFLITGCSTTGTFWEDAHAFFDGMSGMSDNFIATHGEQYRIVDGKVYKGSATKYLESKK